MRPERPLLGPRFVVLMARVREARMAGEALERTENLTRREGVAGVVGGVGGWEGRRVGFWGEAARGGGVGAGGSLLRGVVP